jgi:hypothetical protein
MIFQNLSPELVSLLGRSVARALVILMALGIAGAQQNSTAASPSSPHERTYSQSKIAIEKALKELQASLSGRLPVLDGFAVQGEYPLSRYQRGYYQSTVQVSASASGGSVVRVNTKVTAWYADSLPSRSGYKVLTSNGRLESDLLEQLDELLGANANASGNSGAKSSLDFNAATSPGAGESGTRKTSRNTPNSDKKTPAKKTSTEAGDPLISAPRSPETEQTFSSALKPGRPAASTSPPRDLKTSAKGIEDRSVNGLQAEAASLEETLKNQAHPKNLVAIKKSGTPVVSTPSLNGKTLFLASAQDEFEMLDFNADWVHVRISGLSRGWIWRTSLEMPQGISDIPKTNATGARVIAVADLFQVTREETAPFPGDWEPLRNKTVKIVSVQKIQENEKNSGAEAKLEYSKSLLDKNYAELAEKGRDLAGIVLIFDSVDGGMIAATAATVRAWKAGTLSDSALWHQCYFDPPETFTVSSNPANGR